MYNIQLYEFQISHPGIVLETRKQELSFGTKIYGILGLSDGNISSQSVEVTQNVDYGPETRVAYLASNDDLFILGVLLRVPDNYTKSQSVL